MNELLEAPRRHHYVPRVYLRNFAIQEKNEWHIMVIDKTKKEPYKTNIKNVAVEKDFYRIDNNQDEFYWEHYYAEQIEPLISKTFNNLIAKCTLSLNKSCVIDDDIRWKLAKIICSQLLRTRKARKSQFAIGQRASNNVLEAARKQFEGLLSNEQIAYLDTFDYDEMLNKTFCLPIINEEDRINKFIDVLLKRYWVIYKNINYMKSPLITSDHPVAFYNIMTKKTGFTDNGLAVPQTIILFPINRELIIALYTQDMYFNQMNEFNNKILIIDNIPFVMKLNRIQYENCYRQAFFSFK